MGREGTEGGDRREQNLDKAQARTEQNKPNKRESISQYHDDETYHVLLGLGTRLANLLIVVQKRVHLASLVTNCTQDEKETKEQARKQTRMRYIWE
jgi:hypothetical protein